MSQIVMEVEEKSMDTVGDSASRCKDLATECRPVNDTLAVVNSADSTCISSMELPAHNSTNTSNANSSTTDLFIGSIERLNKEDQGNRHNLVNLSGQNRYSDNKTEDISIVVSSGKLVSAGHHSTTGHNENTAYCGHSGVTTQDNEVPVEDIVCATQNLTLESGVNTSEKINELKVGKECEQTSDQSCCPTAMASEEVNVTFYHADEGNGDYDPDTVVAAKTRRLDTDVEIQEQKSSGLLGLLKVKGGSQGSGSDLESLGDYGEDSAYYTDEPQEPCDCDECLLGEGAVAKPVNPNPMKKQSSWKKIRNMVHWSPFIQQFKRRRYPWIQLAGHQGNFQAGEAGAILKKYDKREHQSFNKLMKDVLRSYVPEYRGEVEKNGDTYVQLQDLLCEFEAPCVMDIKMGCRTYLEEELTKAREKPTLRKDMYQKMVEVDPTAPTEEENLQQAITKPRYMQWRDDMSSSVEMGFRIEGIRKSDGKQVKNFKTTKDKASVKNCLRQFVEENPVIINKYVSRLKAIRVTQESSPFFQSHEVIGSSLLFVHDRCGQASIWMIDFGKTVPLPDNVKVTHRNKWEEGNHEDGYLVGIDSLIVIFEELRSEFKLAGYEQDQSISQDNESSEVIDTNKCESSDSTTSRNCVSTTQIDSQGNDNISQDSRKSNSSDC